MQIQLADVSKHYPGTEGNALEHIDLSVQAGQVVSIIGESGSGKSTLLKLVYGLLSPTGGSVSFEGTPVPGPHEKLIPGHDDMKMVTQDFSLNVYARVVDNISAMLSNTNLKEKEGQTRDMMRFLRIGQLETKRIVELSGGEQQRVALARALITKPKVLLLDEPFSQIDAILRGTLRQDIRRLATELGITVLFVTHDAADGLEMADHLVILKEGRILEQGKPQDIYNQPKHAYTARILGNAGVFSPEQAAALGIRAAKPVTIYPHWVRLKSGWSSKLFTVKYVSFKGFYQELVLERKGVQIGAVSILPVLHRAGEQVSVKIERCVEVDIES